jgi:hypothetical protein
MSANSNEPIDPNAQIKNAAIKDWERTRSAIEHENELTNHRFTWLLATQGFLFTAYWYLTQPVSSAAPPPGHPGLCAVVIIAGAVFAAVLGNSLRTAEAQHEKLSDWFKKRYKVVLDDHPPICGDTPQLIGRPFGYSQWPLMFIVAWIEAAIFTFSERARAYELWLAPTLVLLPLGAFVLRGSGRAFHALACKIGDLDEEIIWTKVRDACNEGFNRLIAGLQKKKQN